MLCVLCHLCVWWPASRKGSSAGPQGNSGKVTAWSNNLAVMPTVASESDGYKAVDGRSRRVSSIVLHAKAEVRTKLLLGNASSHVLLWTGAARPQLLISAWQLPVTCPWDAWAYLHWEDISASYFT